MLTLFPFRNIHVGLGVKFGETYTSCKGLEYIGNFGSGEGFWDGVQVKALKSMANHTVQFFFMTRTSGEAHGLSEGAMSSDGPPSYNHMLYTCLSWVLFEIICIIHFYFFVIFG